MIAPRFSLSSCRFPLPWGGDNILDSFLAHLANLFGDIYTHIYTHTHTHTHTRVCMHVCLCFENGQVSYVTGVTLIALWYLNCGLFDCAVNQAVFCKYSLPPRKASNGQGTVSSLSSSRENRNKYTSWNPA